MAKKTETTKTGSESQNENLVLYMSMERETPGTFVYSESNDQPKAHKIYIRKDRFPDGAPEHIKLTIESVKLAELPTT